MTNTATHRGRLSAGISLGGKRGIKTEAGREDKGQDGRPREPEITGEKNVA